jgi:extracellular elastinolytic metalloproteinase
MVRLARALIALAVSIAAVPAVASAYQRDAAEPFLDRGGSPTRSIQRPDRPLTGTSSADRAGLAWDYIRAHTRALGIDSGDLGGLDLASRTVNARGLLNLRWTQSYKGIPAFDNDVRVNVDKSGRILNVLGAPLHNLTLPSIDPKLTPLQALDAVMRDVGVRRGVRVARAPSGARQQTTFSTGDFARLVIFGGDGAPRLAWHLTYAASSVAHYDAVVDATNGRVLFRQNLTKLATNASVWSNYPGAPNGGTQATVDIAPYLTAGATTLIGPNAHVFSDVDDNNFAQPSEEVAPGAYAFASFAPASGHCLAAALCSWDPATANSWQTNRKQNGVQAFWFVNAYHDHLASSPIGFTSPHNLQDDDPVIVNTDDGAATGPNSGHLDNANMTTYPVGTPATMQMYLWSFASGAPFRDVNGGDDAVIVYHEYTHGLSSRLITFDDGTGAVGSAEAGAMGEAWSDWYAEDYVVRQGLETDGPQAGDIDVGSYVDAQPRVLRTQPLDCPVNSNSAACPGGSTGAPGGYTFGDFGHVVGLPEVHSDGEIWGETLWDLRAALIAHTGDQQTGSDLAERLVTDGMRNSPPEPSFVDERDAILAAVDGDLSGADHDAVKAIVWSVFARRGLGFYAQSLGGNDTAPIEDFLPPPGGPTGTIGGTVTNADTGLPVPGVSVGIGGLAIDRQDPANRLAATTDAAGHYEIAGVPVGTYPELVVFGATGFDEVVRGDVAVTDGSVSTQDLDVHRDWAGRATISSTDDSADSLGCGHHALVDYDQGTGWSPFNPSSTSPDNPHAGPPIATITLPETITVKAFLADPGNACGDDPSAATKGYRIETSPDGTHWTVASEGAFAPADAHRLNTLTPTAGTTNVRYVRLTELSPQSACAGCSGADFIDFSELEAVGWRTPAGTLAASPTTATPGAPITFDAGSFTSPEGAITGYSWDFDGNGTIDRTTSTPSTAFAYPSAGIYTARVLVGDAHGSSGTATRAVSVQAPAVPGGSSSPPQGTPPPVPGPTVRIASRGTRSTLRVTIVCAVACRATGRATIASSLRRKLHLSSRTVASLAASLSNAGTKRIDLKLSSRVRAALRRRHFKSLKLSVRVVVKDAGGRSKTATRTATVKR